MPPTQPAEIAPPRPISPAKLAANRKNALKSTGPRTTAGKQRAQQNARQSTGPRTPAGKRRASLNALKHGLRARNPGDDPFLPQGDAPEFRRMHDQFMAALRPQTPLQHALLPQIVTLAWKLRHLPAAQNLLFQFERRHVAGRARLFAPDIVARRFSDDPNNAFIRLNRYERSIENALFRLLKSFKDVPNLDLRTPLASDERTEPNAPQNALDALKSRISLEIQNAVLPNEPNPPKNRSLKGEF
jgi:hypothetical protein